MAINLDRSGSCTVQSGVIPDNLIEYTNENYEKIYDSRPENRAVVVMHRTDGTTFDYEAKRWSQSYLNTPVWSPDSDEFQNKSYMFGGMDSFSNGSVNGPLPDIFKPYLDFVNKEYDSPFFNQVVVNWYSSGYDFIPFHSDFCRSGCTTMDDTVMVINLCKSSNSSKSSKKQVHDSFEDYDMCRKFVIKPKRTQVNAREVTVPLLELTLRQGTYIKMVGLNVGGFQHGVPKKIHPSYSDVTRVSVTFRRYVDSEKKTTDNSEFFSLFDS